MTRQEQPFEVPSFQLDHPAQPDWFAGGLALMAADPGAPIYQPLRERYKVSDEKFQNLIRTLGGISIHLDSTRAAHEIDNLKILRIAAGGVVSPEALAEYNRLVRRPELAGEQIVWFGRVVTAAYENYFRLQQTNPEAFRRMTDPHNVGDIKNFRQIGIDLRGTRQAGNWQGTGDLDAWADGLADAIRKAEPSAEVTACTKKAEQMHGYKLFPLYKPNSAGFPERDLTTATIRRRRRHSVVRIPNLRQLIIVKESTGWLQLDEVEDERQRIAIKEALQNWDSRTHGQENSPVAKVGGKIFERAIARRQGEVIPINAHYYALGSVDMPVV